MASEVDHLVKVEWKNEYEDESTAPSGPMWLIYKSGKKVQKDRWVYFDEAEEVARISNVPFEEV